MEGSKERGDEHMELVLKDKEFGGEIIVVRFRKKIVRVIDFPDEEVRETDYFPEEFAKVLHTFLTKKAGKYFWKVGKLDTLLNQRQGGNFHPPRFPEILNPKPFRRDTQEVTIPIE
ncbi:hypothetical protein E3V08_06180 [Candidatus Atribacteria bacterium MT.SAG.1]|nr:hypothetical protein E3V08_06180 [Candidatus Atribacteria bacterium MT.SAG.1]